MVPFAMQLRDPVSDNPGSPAAVPCAAGPRVYDRSFFFCDFHDAPTAAVCDVFIAVPAAYHNPFQWKIAQRRDVDAYRNAATIVALACSRGRRGALS
jgi:hypothetical protein